MPRLTIDFETGSVDPKATLVIGRDEVENVILSVASRAARNRTSLYQKKHMGPGAGLYTRQRDHALADLNVPIGKHFLSLKDRVSAPEALRDRRVVGFPISDLTANPLRPHYDASVPEGQRAFHSGATCRAVYGGAAGAQLFYLEDEPIGEVPYTLLLAYSQDGRARLAIHHDVKVARDGSLPDQLPRPVREAVSFWAACPPLLADGEHRIEEYAVRDYDLRHVFGFPKTREDEKELYQIYAAFPSWDRWSSEIRSRLQDLAASEVGYHAALGLNEKEIVILHRQTTIPGLAGELKAMGARDAVLLDSGGSCAIWGNWVDGNRGGVLASGWNFRPDRGAVVFLVLHGERGLPKE